MFKNEEWAASLLYLLGKESEMQQQYEKKKHTLKSLCINKLINKLDVHPYQMQTIYHQWMWAPL